MATDNIKFENTKALLQQRPTRNKVFIVAFVILVMLVAGVLFLVGGHKAKAPPSTATLSAPPNVSSIPGTSKSRDYNSLVEKHNQEDFAHATQTGGSSLPTLAGSNENSLLNPIGTPATPATVAQPAPASTAPIVSHLVTVPPPSPLPQQARPAYDPQAYNEASAQALSSAKSQMQGYLTAFKLGAPSQEFPYYGKTQKPGAAGGDGAGQTSGGDRGAAGAQGSQGSSSATFVRAGTVIPAELLTPVNSDAPGPVLAEITSGPLAGARVLGSFSTQRDAVVLKFNTISMPGYDHSFKVNVFAVNADTLSPGLATDVNHHYLQRFGLLAAAAFISGYGQAESQQGNTVITSPLGGATVVQGRLSSKQIALSALGNVGQQVGNTVQQQASQIRDTVKVQDKHGNGVPVGLLFMSDF